jgi:serine/threonine-protein kinase 24/25/MST4
MDAREIESLSMLSRGFTELKDANPELAYNVILDVLSGINEYVAFTYPITSILIVYWSATLQCANMFKPRVVYSHTNASFARAR